MKKKVGYVFTYGVDGFGADVAPATEEGFYTDFDKAFQRLVELNHEEIKKNCDFFKKDEIAINKQFINEEPWYGMYAIEEIEIKD